MIKVIPEFPEYSVSDSGIVYKGDYELTQIDNGIGYLYVRFTKNYRRYRKYVHRLVYEIFKGPIINEINHIDHNKYNNHISNLEDISHRDNIMKSFETYGYYGFLEKYS